MALLEQLLLLKNLPELNLVTINREIIPVLAQKPCINLGNYLYVLGYPNVYQAEQRAKCEAQAIQDLGIAWTTNVFQHSDYPRELLDLGDRKPYLLFYQGDLKQVKKNKVAVFGAKQLSNAGTQKTVETVNQLMQEGDTSIVGGLAAGCDALALQTCIDNGGAPVAFLPCGFDKLFPTSNAHLAKRIAAQGVVFSEYLPWEAAQKINFERRNELAVAFANTVYGNEVPMPSGAMLAMRQAEAMGKEISVLI